MRLVHMSEGPLNELKAYMETLDNTFNLTENDMSQDIKQTFRRYEKARISFDAPIVANLCLHDNSPSKERAESQQPRAVHKNKNLGKVLISKTSDLCQYTMTLATKSNMVYQINFERYYLQKNHTIHVQQSDANIFDHLAGQKIRCLDKVFDSVNQRDLFVIGSATYIPPQQMHGENRANQISSQIDQTLTFMDDQRNVFSLSTAHRDFDQNGQGAQQNAGWLSRLANNLQRLAPEAPWGQAVAAQGQNPAGQNQNVTDKFKQAMQESLVAPQQNIKNMEGVLAIKVLSNNLIAVVYTNGLLRIIQISNFTVLVESNLLGDEGKFDLKDQFRVFNAQLAFSSHASVANHQQTSMSKSISIGISLGIEHAQTAAKQFCLQTVSLRFENVPAVDPELESSIALGDNCELIHARQELMARNVSITNVSACQNSSFLYTTFNLKTRETSIFSTSSAQPIWDRGSQEVKHQLADKVPISLEILQKAPQPQIDQALKRHYLERITAPGRFTPESIYALLADINLFDQNYSIKENLVRVIQQSAVKDLPRFLDNLIELDSQNGRILSLSQPLQERPSWRVLVRPLGICIVSETSYISSIEAAINLGSNEREFYWATSDTKLLVEYLGLVKTTMAESLHLLSQRIGEQPESIREAANFCIMNASNQEVVQKLSFMLKTAAPDIQDQLKRFEEEILTKLVLNKAGKANQNYKMNVDIDNEMPKLTDFGMKVQEQTIRQEIDALLQLLIDLYLGQILLQKATQTLYEARLQKLESWIRQLSALLNAFNQDFEKSKLAFVARPLQKIQSQSTEDLEITRHGNVLQHLLSNSREQILVDNNDYQGAASASILTKTIQFYCQNDLVIDEPTFVPRIVRQLCELNQHNTAMSYLKTVSTETLGTLFAQVYCMTCKADKVTDKSQFLRAVMELISRTLQLSEKAQTKVVQESALLAPRSNQAREQIRDRVENLMKDKPDARLQFLLTCTSELSSIEVAQLGGAAAEHFASFFIRKCLSLESQQDSKILADWTQDEREYLLICLFECQRSVSAGVETLYRAVINMRNLKTRQAYLLKFFETVRSPNRPQHVRTAILTSCPFSQTDITLLVEAIQIKLEEQLKSSSQVYTQRWREETCNLVQIYFDVSQLYHWQDQFVRFTWSQWETSFQTLMNPIGNKKGQFEQVLSMIVHWMTLAFTACQSCGQDFYFHSTKKVVAKSLGVGSAGNARKRTYNEAMASGQMQVDQQRKTSSDQSNESTAFWQSVDSLRSHPSIYNQGKLVKINLKSVLGALMLCKAKLFCQKHMPSAAMSNEAGYLSKVLAELDQIDQAIELALSNDVSPAFAIATKLDKLKNQDIRDGEDEEEDQMRQAKIDDTVSRYLKRVKVEHLGELAQYLVSLRISFSKELTEKLIQQKQVSYVVGCYLSPSVQDVVRAVQFLCNSDSEVAVQILIQSDLNQVVNLLRQCKESQKVFADYQRDLESQRDSIKNSLAQSNQGLKNRHWRAEGGSSSRVGSHLGFQAAMLGHNDVIAAILDEDQVAGYDQFDTSAQVEKDLKKCISNGQTLTDGINKIKSVLSKELR